MPGRRRKKQKPVIPNVKVTISHDKLEESIAEIPITKFAGLETVSLALAERSVQRLVCVGVGDMCSSLSSRIQLALALKLREKLDLKSMVFSDPGVCDKCELFLVEHGFSVDKDHFDGSFEFSPDTAFFLPHCPRIVNHNLLVHNWNERMNDMLIVGNPFSFYSERYKLGLQKIYSIMIDIFDAGCVEETPLDFSNECAFYDTVIVKYKPGTDLPDVKPEPMDWQSGE